MNLLVLFFELHSDKISPVNYFGDRDIKSCPAIMSYHKNLSNESELPANTVPHTLSAVFLRYSSSSVQSGTIFPVVFTY